MGNEFGIDLIITKGSSGMHFVKAPGYSTNPGDLCLFEDSHGTKLSERAVCVMNCAMGTQDTFLEAVSAFGEQPIAVSAVYRRSWVMKNA